MKKLIAIGAMALALTTCSSPASGQVTSAVVHQRVIKEPVKMPLRGNHPSVALVRSIAAIKLERALRSNTIKLNNVISLLKGRVHKTWYVFSGDTPAGWDCSGLTMWAYEQLGVNLEHRASKQQFAGVSTSDPKPGDIVVFTYKGSKSAYHVGIYLSPDKMIHAGGGKGQYTSIVSISKFAGNYSVVSYRRILQTI
jgi:cell wall-associated NlpC family hydrolase